MKKYTVQVSMSYVHIIDVQADSLEEAENIAFGQFDLNKANQADGECWVISEDEDEVTL